MKLDSVENVVGIYLEDGSVKCRKCMSEDDWKNLKHKRIITKRISGKMMSGSTVITARRGFEKRRPEIKL